ncbi:MAG: acetylesterase [Treponema sp.]|jgi:S-formylglutathione hydrolase FrmB|nr:acetylesterase [Treponema sp.]
MILQGSVYSEALAMRTGLNVFIPDALEGREDYRVIYLLHGLHGDSRMWFENTMAAVFAKSGDAVIVAPEVGRSFYADMKHGYRYWTYVSGELPGICRRIFNISAKPEDTGVIGCSMGGYGALKTALAKPMDFGFCGAIAPACLFFDEILKKLRLNAEEYGASSPEAEALLNDFRNIFGEDLQYTASDLILELAKKAASAQIKPKIYTACGTQDGLLEENRRFDAEMRKLPFDWTYEEWNGAHDWLFFNAALEKALKNWGVAS